MTRQEFDRIVAEAVAVGADLKDAELHVIRGFHIATDENGQPVFSTDNGQGAVDNTEPPAAETNVVPLTPPATDPPTV